MTHWFSYPNIDPVAFHLGPIAVHWYGLSYLFGFLCVYLWLNRPAGRERLGLTSEQIQDFLVNALIGVLIGGRAFFVFADILSHHNALWYIQNPINIIAVWNGGMGFFGGLLGVIVAMLLFVRRHPGLRFEAFADEIVILLPIGLFTTRIVNFINDELPGNVCIPDHPWCMLFPNFAGYRYPSQILEGVLDVLAIPLLLPLARRRPPDGVVAWAWLMWYGIARSIDEVWRVTDIRFGPLTGAQALSLPMIVLGAVMVVRCYRRGDRMAPRGLPPGPTTPPTTSTVTG